jgi:predicted nucleotidyltransferase
MTEHRLDMLQPLPLNIDPFHATIVRRIVSLLHEKNLMAVLIVISGSRAKGVASKDSDYDMNVVAMSSRAAYLLQEVNLSSNFSIEVEGVEVEGTITDICKLRAYVLGQNMKAHDVFASIPIYATQIAQDMRTIWHETCDPKSLARSLKGMLMVYKMKKLDGGTRRSTTRKVALECVYLSLKILLLQHQRGPPSYDLPRIVDATTDCSTTRRDWISDLLQRRIAAKEEGYATTAEFYELIEEALCAEIESRTSDEKAVTAQLNRQFLSLFA